MNHEPPHGNRKYRWENWLDGLWHTFRPRTISAVSFQKQVIGYASQNGLKAKTRVQKRKSGDVVKFQFSARDPE